MTHLDAAIARLRALPEDRRDAVAAQIGILLDDIEDDLLTSEQWAEVENRLDLEEATIPHADIVRAFEQRTE